jgi:hypothetical protein
MNVSAKSGSKITSEDLLSRLQKKDGYIYAELYWWESKSSDDETYILGSNSCEQNTISTVQSTHSFFFRGKCTRDTRKTHTGYNNCFY